MNYALGYVRALSTNRGDEPHIDHELNLAVDVSYEEYKRASAAIQILHDFRSQAKLLSTVGLNYQDYLRVLRVTVPTYIRVRDRERKEIDMEAIRLELNRYLINYVSSVTLYLARMEILAKKKHSDNPEFVAKFKSYRHEAYDSSFSYRFVYFLRNYSQHTDMPIDGAELTSAVDRDTPDVITHSLRVFMRRDSLLQNHHFKTQREEALKVEFSRLPPEIDLTPHLTAMMNALETIHARFMKDELVDLKPTAAALLEVISKLPAREDTDPVLAAFEAVREGPELGGGNTVKNMRLTAIPMSLIEKILAEPTSNP